MTACHNNVGNDVNAPHVYVWDDSDVIFVGLYTIHCTLRHVVGIGLFYVAVAKLRKLLYARKLLPRGIMHGLRITVAEECEFHSLYVHIEHTYNMAAVL